MQDLSRLVVRVANTKATLLIRGESGTGKELIARAIHQLSTRKNNAFVAVDCTNIPANLMESELFGHERGAFTDANATKKGLLEIAGGGTVMLDEIGLMPLELQAKLLNVSRDTAVSSSRWNRRDPGRRAFPGGDQCGPRNIRPRRAFSRRSLPPVERCTH